MPNIKHTQDFDNAAAADAFFFSVENDYEKAAVVAMPAKGIWRVTYGNYDAKPIEQQYSEMLDKKEHEAAAADQADFERIAKSNIAEQLADSVEKEDADFFVAGFLGHNPKFTQSGSITQAGASAKAAYKSGKAARLNKENQRLVRVETVKVRAEYLQSRSESSDASYADALMDSAEGRAKMGAAGWDKEV